MTPLSFVLHHDWNRNAQIAGFDFVLFSFREYLEISTIYEQLPEDGLVRPKHVVIKCDSVDILKQMRDPERFVLHWRRKRVNGSRCVTPTSRILLGNLALAQLA
jgi:hypothetical protein